MTSSFKDFCFIGVAGRGLELGLMEEGILVLFSANEVL